MNTVWSQSNIHWREILAKLQYLESHKTKSSSTELLYRNRKQAYKPYVKACQKHQEFLALFENGWQEHHMILGTLRKVTIETVTTRYQYNSSCTYNITVLF